MHVKLNKAKVEQIFKTVEITLVITSSLNVISIDFLKHGKLDGDNCE